MPRLAPRFTTDRPGTRGFTLVELIVVLSIIVIASAITFPFLGAMTRDLAASNGVNTVQAATTAARAYATRDRSSLVIGFDTVTGEPISADYSGAAALFTPNNLIRLVENDGAGLRLQNRDGLIEVAYKSDNIVLNGFEDIVGREPIQLDANVGVVGIVRSNDSATYPARDGSTTAFIPPPFAVWFSQAGSVVAGVPLPNSSGSAAERDAVDRSRNRLLYYDWDQADGLETYARDLPPDGDWNAVNRSNPERGGGGTYDVDEFDPSSPDYDRGIAFNDNLNREAIPFEEIETVIGVVVYDKREFRDAGLDWPDSPSGSAIAQWLVDNGTAVFFSPTSGVAFREANQQ